MTIARYAVELRSRLDGNTLYGHASVFGPMAKVPGHLERMAPSAFDAALKREDTDVRALVNHNPSAVLGRQSAGTLRVNVDDDGLAFEVDLPDTSYARDVRELVARGDMTGASFAMIPGEDEWETRDGKQLRTHTSVAELLDVSVVTFPAYDGAVAELRHYDFGTANTRRSQMIRARARVLLKGEK